MRNQNLPSGFSPFAWAIAAFCFPIFLWPLAMLISPHLLNNTHLSDNQITAMSIFLWVYPFSLASWRAFSINSINAARLLPAEVWR